MKGTLNGLLFLYLLVCFLSFFQGLVHTNLIYEPFRQMKGIVYLLAFFILQQFVREEKDLRNVFHFLFILGFLCALWQLLFIKFPSLISFYDDGYVVSRQGTINGFPRIFFVGSTFFMQILPAFLIFGLSPEVKRSNRWILLIAYIFFFIIFSLTLILSFVVQNIIAALVVFFLRCKKPKSFVILFPIILFMLILFISTHILFPQIGEVPDIFCKKLETSKFSLKEGNLAYRVQQIPRAWETMKNTDLSFLIGIGLGTGYETDLVYEWDPTIKYRAPSLELNHLNAFLLLGSLGTIVYVLLLLYFTFASIKRYLRVRKSRWEPYQLSVVLIWTLGLLNPYGGYFWYAQGTLLLSLLFFVHTFVGQKYHQERQSLLEG